MAITKKKTTATKPETKKTEDVIVGQDTITVKIRKGTEYSKEAIEIGRTISITEDDDANEKIGELIGELDGIAEEYIGQFAATGGYEESEEKESEDGDEEESGDDEIDEDAIRAMGKVELKKFIKDNDLEVDPSEYKKLDDLKDAVIEALSEGGEEEEADNESEGDEEGDEVDEETIRGMDRKELVAFIKENDLGIDPKEYKKLSDLQDAVIEQISENGEEEGLTSEEVMEMDREQLIELIEENELDINPKKFKKTSDLAEAVCEKLFEEDAGDFDDTDFEEE